MSRISDLTGRSFGRLTVLQPTPERRGSSVVWECRCVCGRRHTVPARHLRGGYTKSCGCLRRETTPRNAGRCPQPERDAVIRRERAAGASLIELAAKYGLTRQRVHQIATAVRDRVLGDELLVYRPFGTNCRAHAASSG
jgi:hypothetical protein